MHFSGMNLSMTPNNSRLLSLLYFSNSFLTLFPRSVPLVGVLLLDLLARILCLLAKFLLELNPYFSKKIDSYLFLAPVASSVTYSNTFFHNSGLF